MPEESIPEEPTAQPAAAYRALTPEDDGALAALDLAVQRAEDPGFDALPEREREGRLSSSVAALKFYGRSGHSFAAVRTSTLLGAVLAQSVWQGDKPIVLVRTVLIDPQLSPATAEDIRAGLLRALFKSAYDTAVYEVHFLTQPGASLPAELGDIRHLGRYSVRYLGSREDTAQPSRPE